jgi:signal transduction histidine kinase
MRNENIEVVRRLAADTPRVMANANQLKQVFLNIIVNARHAMSGGGTLTVATRATDEGGVEIALGDTGGGMSPEVAQRIFDPFFTTREKGSGLGLYVARSVTDFHGGKLTLKPNAGGGTVASLFLPANVTD